MNDRDTAKCLFEDYVKALTRIMNIIGVDETVAILRSSADKLEANKTLLEVAQGHLRPAVRA